MKFLESFKAVTHMPSLFEICLDCESVISSDESSLFELEIEVVDSEGMLVSGNEMNFILFFLSIFSWKGSGIGGMVLSSQNSAQWKYMPHNQGSYIVHAKHKVSHRYGFCE